jgi:Mg-chelatase subunit ChlD
MAALVNALDNYTNKQIGENGHVEYGWSNNVQERIVQFSFQVTRTDEKGVKKLQIILKGILVLLKHTIDKGTFPERLIAKEYLSVLYRIIGQTRDIIDGKGEYELSYMMIYTWYDFYPELSKFALKCLVDLGDKNVHQYGSWKDIKYFCKYCKNNSHNSRYNLEQEHPLIEYAIQLINHQLNIDYQSLLDNIKNISLLARWVPREKSSFGWLYQSLAVDYYKNYMSTAVTELQIKKAILKCKTEYRKILSQLNKKIDTLQIKQCAQQWRNIDFDKVTSISVSKQKKAFLNINKNGEVRYPYNNDRMECAENFKTRIKNAISGDDNVEEIKGKRVGMADFTKQALELITCPNQDEIDLLNSQWRDSSSQTSVLGNMIAMVDVSGSMEGDPMNAAIALGIRIANKSVLGKRIMTFSNKPSWVNLEAYDNFVSQVEVIRRANWGMNTNIYAALDMILDSIIQSQLSPLDIKDMILVILSDMQIDAGDNSDKNALYETMTNKYRDAGIRNFGKPLLPPHVLFWNLSSTSGFPTLSSQPNCSMMSGFSPALLNQFCEEGMNVLLQSCSPWSVLIKSLNNERYKILYNKFDQEINLV